MDYAGLVTRLTELMVTTATDPDFVAILPAAIDYAELRIYRELDLLSTTTRYAAQSTQAQNRVLTIPAGTLVTVQRVNVITPASTQPDAGTRNALLPVSQDVLDAVYPNANTAAAVPAYFAMLTDTQIMFGPWPDNSYVVEIVGTARPAKLASTNTTTALTLYFPDLFVAACMVFMAGYMKNYGATADDPQQPGSWESMYQKLSMGAGVEEARKKFQSTGMTSLSPMPIATANVGQK